MFPCLELVHNLGVLSLWLLLRYQVEAKQESLCITTSSVTVTSFSVSEGIVHSNRWIITLYKAVPEDSSSSHPSAFRVVMQVHLHLSKQYLCFWSSNAGQPITRYNLRCWLWPKPYRIDSLNIFNSTFLEVNLSIQWNQEKLVNKLTVPEAILTDPSQQREQVALAQMDHQLSLLSFCRAAKTTLFDTASGRGKIWPALCI